ncbi:TonB-dependent siderophore receptor [Azonexus sp.]|uniref:TonB-dependent receptor plug domain-containing protein n=1 Tax=Azonexus sp. TaxID=1872668 RepID=UPI0027B972DD|nr:TonB-dependent receptor [Azonexus sp.]
MKTLSRRVLPLLLVSAFSSAMADEDIFFAELPVVGSVSRLQQRLADAPASVSVIDRDMIRASGVRSLNDIFRLVPGFQTFAHSDAPARVTYHGITDDNDFSPRVQVLIDGRSLHSPLFRGGMNWALVPVALEDIERIEVVRGSNSVSYGTNAFLGVVNIITIDPSLVRGVSVSASNGNQGVRDYTVRGGGAFGDAGNFRLTYQEASDDGLDNSYNWRDKYRNRRLDARFDYQVNSSDALELNFGKVDGRFARGRLDLEATPVVGEAGDPLRNLEESSTWMQMRWLRTLSADADFSLRYTFSEDKGNESFIDPDYPPGFEEINLSGDWGQRHELEAVHHFSPAGNTRVVWGASWRRDAMSSNTLLRGLGTVKRDVWRSFANGEWKPTTWLTANLGVSNEYDTLAGNQISPRTSLAFHLTPENTVRLGYSQAWRSSSILAYRANYRQGPTITRNDQIGNPQLPAERLDSWELAYLGDWRALRMSLDVRHFREKLTDRVMLIRPGPSSNPVTPRSEQSIQDIDIQGYEFQWKWSPFETTRILLNHASIKIDSRFSDHGETIAAVEGSNLWFTSDVEKYVNLAENSAPHHSSSVMFMQKLPYGFDFSLSRYWVDAMKWTRNTNVGKYKRTDARLAYPFSLAGQRGEVAYTVQSLNGAHNEQRGAGSEPTQRTVDRRHWLTLRLDL